MENNQIQKQIKLLNHLLQKPENKHCADCSSSNPNWASINIGVFLCIKCSSIHRQLGTHISKIKSINLDLWPLDVLNNFKYINNEIANDFWEYKIRNKNKNSLKINDNLLFNFIKAKYQDKLYVKNLIDVDPMTRIINNKKINKENNVLNRDINYLNDRYFINNDNKNNLNEYDNVNEFFKTVNTNRSNKIYHNYNNNFYNQNFSNNNNYYYNKNNNIRFSYNNNINNYNNNNNNNNNNKNSLFNFNQTFSIQNFNNDPFLKFM